METIKGIVNIFLGIILIVGVIIGIIFVANYVVNSHEDAEWARTIQCKEVGGVWTYENYNWYCK